MSDSKGALATALLARAEGQFGATLMAAHCYSDNEKRAELIEKALTDHSEELAALPEWRLSALLYFIEDDYQISADNKALGAFATRFQALDAEQGLQEAQRLREYLVTDAALLSNDYDTEESLKRTVDKLIKSDPQEAASLFLLYEHAFTRSLRKGGRYSRYTSNGIEVSKRDECLSDILSSADEYGMEVYWQYLTFLHYVLQDEGAVARLTLEDHLMDTLNRHIRTFAEELQHEEHAKKPWLTLERLVNELAKAPEELHPLITLTLVSHYNACYGWSLAYDAEIVKRALEMGQTSPLHQAMSASLLRKAGDALEGQLHLGVNLVLAGEVQALSKTVPAKDELYNTGDLDGLHYDKALEDALASVRTRGKDAVSLLRFEAALFKLDKASEEDGLPAETATARTLRLIDSLEQHAGEMSALARLETTYYLARYGAYTDAILPAVRQIVGEQKIQTLAATYAESRSTKSFVPLFLRMRLIPDELRAGELGSLEALTKFIKETKSIYTANPIYEAFNTMVLPDFMTLLEEMEEPARMALFTFYKEQTIREFNAYSKYQSDEFLAVAQAMLVGHSVGKYGEVRQWNKLIDEKREKGFRKHCSNTRVLVYFSIFAKRQSGWLDPENTERRLRLFRQLCADRTTLRTELTNGAAWRNGYEVGRLLTEEEYLSFVDDPKVPVIVRAFMAAYQRDHATDPAAVVAAGQKAIDYGQKSKAPVLYHNMVVSLARLQVKADDKDGARATLALLQDEKLSGGVQKVVNNLSKELGAE